MSVTYAARVRWTVRSAGRATTTYSDLPGPDPALAMIAVLQRLVGDGCQRPHARKVEVFILRRPEENERRVPALYYLDAECERDAPDFAVERELLERLRELEAWRDGGRLDELRRIEEGGR